MINITNEDNMDLISRYKDNYFDLAIVDPPYGINQDKVQEGLSNKKDLQKMRELIKSIIKQNGIMKYLKKNILKN